MGWQKAEHSESCSPTKEGEQKPHTAEAGGDSDVFASLGYVNGPKKLSDKENERKRPGPLTERGVMKE